jgi:hypothetical protein
VRGFLALVLLAGCQRTDPAQTAASNCAKVAEQLASFEVGAHAPPAQRAQAVAKHRAACESVGITGDEVACLDRARDTWAARACLPKLFPAHAAAGCGTFTARLRQAVQAQAGADSAASLAAIDGMLPIMKASCEQDHWPASILSCVAEAAPGDMNAFQRCSALLSKDLQDKLSTRLLAQQQQQQQQQGGTTTPPAQ